MDFQNNSLQSKQAFIPKDYSNYSNNIQQEPNKQVNDFTFQQIENFLQSQYQICVPALVFEYSSQQESSDFSGWDYEDLLEFFSHFGDIDTLEILKTTSVVLFKTFFDANTAREFLQNNNNFKETEKNNFVARWYKLDDEHLVTETMRKKISVYTNRFLEMQMKRMSLMNSMKMGSFNQNQNQMQNSGNNFLQYKGGLDNNNNNSYNSSNSNSYSNGFNSKPMFNTNMTPQNTNKRNDENQNGKFTCRFEIQIENCKDFQVARRLIGSKVN